MQENNTPKKRKYRGNKTLTTIFYTLYVLFILAFLGGIYHVNGALEETLTQYEQSHIQVQSQAVFDTHFSQPDWQALYQMAGIQDTPFEDASHYAAWMEQALGSDPLTYTEIPTEEGHLYQLTAEDQIFGTFRMTDRREPGAKWPSWQLDGVTLVVPRDISIQVRKLDTHTVTVNGVPLEDAYTTRIDTLLAEEYALPGTDGIATHLQQVEGFLMVPQVAVLDENGDPCPVTVDPETGIYEQQLPQSPDLTPGQSQAAVKAVKAWGGYKLKSTSRENLGLYFHPTKDAYKQILSEGFWTEEAHGYVLEATDILAFQVYGEDHFSVYAAFRARESGSETRHEKSATFFFTQYRGSWTCYQIQPGSVYTPVSKVRLEFLVDGISIYYDYFETDRTTFPVPLVTAPEGQRFAGWGAGDIRLVPDEAGLVTLAPGTELTPLVLEAIFEPSEGGN